MRPVRYPKMVALTPWIVEVDVNAPVKAPPDRGSFAATDVVKVLICVCTLDVTPTIYPNSAERTPWMVDVDVTTPDRVPPARGSFAAAAVVRVFN